MAHPHPTRRRNPARPARSAPAAPFAVATVAAVAAVALAATFAALASGCSGAGRSATDQPAPADSAAVRADGAGAGGGLGGPAVAATDGRVAVVNDRCPVMREHSLAGMRVSGDKVRQFEGKAVGFCCGECLGAWTNMSQAERREALRAVTPTMDR